MKKRLLFLIILVGVMVLPFKVKATDYKSLNFTETLEAEEIDLKYTSYKETDDQVTIYLFRGQGCSYCRGFLNFLNDNAEDLGKYFKVVSYEVWKDTNNAKLLTEVSEYLEQPADGVPYIIIGDQVFAGFTESAYGEKVKEAITTLYKTDKADRYDVFEQMEKNPKTTNKNESDKKDKSSSNLAAILLNLLFVVVGTISIIVYNHFNFEKLSAQISKKSK